MLEPAYLVLLIFVVVPCSFCQPRHTESVCSFTAYLADVEASATCAIAFCVELGVNFTALLTVRAVPITEVEVFGYSVLVCLCFFSGHRLPHFHGQSVCGSSFIALRTDSAIFRLSSSVCLSNTISRTVCGSSFAICLATSSAS